MIYRLRAYVKHASDQIEEKKNYKYMKLILPEMIVAGVHTEKMLTETCP